MMQMKCNKCSVVWGIEETKESLQKASTCPICTFEESVNKSKQIKKLEELLSCYQKVLLDLGVDSIKIGKTND